jgi:hypothetical protein
MTKLVRYWQRATFWGKLEKSFSIIGSTITAVMVLSEADKIWTIIVIAATILSALIGLWFDDKNKDGISDILQ